MPTIQELVAQIRADEIVLPEFQRGYVWTRDQVPEIRPGVVQAIPNRPLAYLEDNETRRSAWCYVQDRTV